MAEGFIEDRAKPPQHPDNYLGGVYRCGQNRDHKVKIHRSKWPPKQHPGLNDRAFVSGHCERCGAVCLVYDPIPHDMTVVLYGDPSEQQGRVEDEAGQVVAEETQPVAGSLVNEEDEPRRIRGRR